MKDTSIIKIILVDDHTVLRHGLRQSLEVEPDFHVVGEAENGKEAIKKALELNPDVVVMDVSMPGLNGMEATRIIRDKNPDIRVLALSMYSEQIYVMGMLNAGASGFLLKAGSFRELSSAIRTVAEGKVYLAPEVTGIVVDNVLHPSSSQDPVPETELTKRDREVLQLIAEGKKSIDIADELKISKRTVDIHRRNLMDKLNIRNVAALTKYAVRQGITSLY